jgi:hypothetical protein
MVAAGVRVVGMSIPAALRRPVGAFLIVLAAFAAGIGVDAASQALWFFPPVWRPWLLAGTAAVVALSAWWLWWQLPRRQVDRLRLTIRDAKARADVEDNYRKTIGQLLGGAAVLVGAGLAYLQFTQQQQASRDLLISNQVAKGFELLGNKDNQLQQRLGGIYALEGVMNTSKEYYRPVLEALCAFVRDGTKTKTDDEPPTSDIQATLTVIERRAVLGEGSPDLHDAHVPKAVLFNTNLSRWNLSGANLSGANLSRANLSRADLSGALLIGADLGNANLSGANLSRADLSGALLNGANLHAILHLANLSHAFLIGADLSGALLIGANLSGAHLSSADLSHAFLSAADLSGADLGGPNGLTQEQLDLACGRDVKGLDPPLTFKDKPCYPREPSR